MEYPEGLRLIFMCSQEKTAFHGEAVTAKGAFKSREITNEKLESQGHLGKKQKSALEFC